MNDDLLDYLKGAKLFNKFDLKSSYTQVPNEQIDLWKTTFKYKEGDFEWLIMTFNLIDVVESFM